MRKTILCAILALSAMLSTNAQITFRNLSDCDPTAFCSFQETHPAEIINKGDNWKIVQAFQKKGSTKTLDKLNIQYSDSCLKQLTDEGFLEYCKGQYHTIIHIFNEQQTKELVDFGQKVAKGLTESNKEEFKKYVALLNKKGFRNNAYSLTFSYLLDDRLWDFITPREKIHHYSSWSGCYWVKFKREKNITGTNTAVGEDSINLSVTFSSNQKKHYPYRLLLNTQVAVNENGVHIKDSSLIADNQKYGVCNASGNVLVPFITSNNTNEIYSMAGEVAHKLVDGMQKYMNEFQKKFNISNYGEAQVILAHELIWDIIDNLIEDKIVEKPSILMGKDIEPSDIKYTIFFTQGKKH